MGRYGGDEFVLVLNNTNELEAYDISNKVRRLLEETDIIFDNKIINTTASFGVCTFKKECGKSIDKFIDCADRALYLAKNEGRNKVKICNCSENINE